MNRWKALQPSRQIVDALCFQEIHDFNELSDGLENALETSMSIGQVVNIAGGYLQSLITRAMSGSSSTTTSVGNTQSTNEPSPFAQVLSSLQQLEQSSLSQYQQVTQQVASNLQTASASATTAGNTPLASQLTQLSTDFQNASTSGQLPNVQDLAQAIGAGLQKG
jgi:hypothetical protein